MDAWMARQECLHVTSAMNGVLVPQHDDRSRHDAQQMLQKTDHTIAGHRLQARLAVQLHLASCRAHTDGPDQVHALVMLDACANGRRLPTRCPGALERRNQRKAAFIQENQGRAPLMPLFLSAARRNASNGQSPHRRAAALVAVGAGSSSPVAATGTTCHWHDSGSETTPRSGERCGPGSNNLLYNPQRRRHVSELLPSDATGRPTTGWGDPAPAHAPCACAGGTPAANGIHSALSRPPAEPLALDLARYAAAAKRAAAAEPVVQSFRRVACAYYGTASLI